MAFLDYVTSTAMFFWHLLGVWLAIFIAPFRSFDVAWIAVPIWLSWFFADYFQEKSQTSFGNVVSNGVVPIWISLDWTRFLIEALVNGMQGFSWMLVVKFVFCALMLAYGVTILVTGLKARKWARKFGRIREVTYLLLMLTPVIYGVMDLSWYVVLAMIIYFPLWYFGISLLFKYLPSPKAARRDEAGV